MCWHVAAIVLSFEMTEMACAGSVSAGDRLAGKSRQGRIIMCQRINHHALNYLDRRAENAWMDAMQDHVQNGGRGRFCACRIITSERQL